MPIAPTLKSPPRQARSAATLRRILAATERLLRRDHFEDLAIQDILAEARVSVGSFYARFRSKEDLLPLLYSAYADDLAARLGDALAPARWAGRPLAERVRRLVAMAVSGYRERRGLLRAVALHARSRPRDVPASRRLERAGQYEAAAALLLACGDEIAHRDPALAVRTGMLFVLATCRDKILFADAPHPASVPLTDEQLAAELAHALLAYLTTRPGPTEAP